MTTLDDLNALHEAPWTNEDMSDLADDIMKQRKDEMSSSITKDLLKRRNKNTPDFTDLVAKGESFVFVYGTLRPGNSNFGLLEGSKYLGQGVTTTAGFILRKGRHFPAVKRYSKEDLAGKILGDVFAVDALTMLELDRLEGNTEFYTREKTFVTLLDQEVPMKNGTKGRPTIHSWIYLIPEDDTSFDSSFLGSSKTYMTDQGKKIRTYEWSQPSWNNIFDS